ncbi:MarR family winged helix-turn-helix transcriptional regulator [Desulfosporosinus sp. BICA1-9]|uniref:MarR family winged helix-turn-helix transcriptional regulator n=1 Tax=Desulfosporosinus sp. BICA1-9 TaxID=1531958 RepID=UPI00054C2637|nr:MarR family transcriptional regulator [Desulfosporosinus sp. BICA1-9]KJS46688.1 MAG: TrmB family transcriptional regulator [Peptococcaceae bacterium BRH_c23]KJS77810.1 MAG: TrmB family transcriptional regulator [Desulfosporosinus sp. BICA1-9]HBW34775.1 TrmB family transcriptional regulator [Desulfosporosinus sp.]
MVQNEVLDLVLDNLRKVFYPEEWIQLDLAVSKTELLAMLIVDRYGEVIMSQISDYINAPLSTTTGLVNRLVKNGYLQRERSEEDRRIVAIRLTDKGKSMMTEVKESIGSYLERINTVLSTEERQTLLKIFMKIVDALSREDIVSGDNQLEKVIRKIPIE